MMRLDHSSASDACDLHMEMAVDATRQWDRLRDGSKGERRRKQVVRDVTRVRMMCSSKMQDARRKTRTVRTGLRD